MDKVKGMAAAIRTVAEGLRDRKSIRAVRPRDAAVAMAEAVDGSSDSSLNPSRSRFSVSRNIGCLRGRHVNRNEFTSSRLRSLRSGDSSNSRYGVNSRCLSSRSGVNNSNSRPGSHIGCLLDRRKK